MPRTNGRNKKTGRPGGKLLWFFGRFLVFFVLVALLWTFVTPLYNRIVVGAAALVFPLIENPATTLAEAKGDEVLIYLDAPGGAEPVLFQGFTRYVYLALVPLLALLLATPNLGVLRRAKLVLIGVGILMCFHIVYLVAAVKLSHVFLGPRDVGRATFYLCDWMQILIRILWEAVAVLIWAALTVKYWRRSPQANTNKSVKPA